MSLYEYLIQKGLSKEEANSACCLVENDIIPDEPIESMYWEWWNKEWLVEQIR